MFAKRYVFNVRDITANMIRRRELVSAVDRVTNDHKSFRGITKHLRSPSLTYNYVLLYEKLRCKLN